MTRNATYFGALVVVGAMSTAVQAAPQVGPIHGGPAPSIETVQYIEGTNRHRNHHGHVHGNPHRTHLDCRSYGNHEHCQVHRPRHHHGDYGHRHDYDRYDRYDRDERYAPRRHNW